MVSHWLSCGIFLLSELVAGQGEIFPSPYGSGKVGFLLGMQGTYLPVGVYGPGLVARECPLLASPLHFIYLGFFSFDVIILVLIFFNFYLTIF